MSLMNSRRLSTTAHRPMGELRQVPATHFGLLPAGAADGRILPAHWRGLTTSGTIPGVGGLAAVQAVGEFGIAGLNRGRYATRQIMGGFSLPLVIDEKSGSDDGALGCGNDARTPNLLNEHGDTRSTGNTSANRLPAVFKRDQSHDDREQAPPSRRTRHRAAGRWRMA